MDKGRLNYRKVVKSDSGAWTKAERTIQRKEKKERKKLGGRTSGQYRVFYGRHNGRYQTLLPLLIALVSTIILATARPIFAPAVS